MNSKNPFITVGYVSPELFCDREKEVEELLKNAKNGVHTTLISTRRLGKTGLIYRFFDEVNRRQEAFITVYADIFSSRSLDDFVKLLSEAILSRYPERTSVGRHFLQLLKGFRPLISYDALSGAPQVQIGYQSVQHKEYTLKGLLDFLERCPQQVVLVIDEFQQIAEYPEKNTEALLRTHIQAMKNVRCIFCGSKKTMMLEIFSNAKRPFFGMTQYLHLDKIDAERYADFIQALFAGGGKRIERATVDFILAWTLRHTYYTQMLCNETFATSKQSATMEHVKAACAQILRRHEPIFLQYRQLLTPAQWNYLIAVAKEEQVVRLTAQDFIGRYAIGTPANSKRLAQALLDKDLLLANSDLNGTTYQIYDVFLMRWLQSIY